MVCSIPRYFSLRLAGLRILATKKRGTYLKPEFSELELKPRVGGRIGTEILSKLADLSR